VLSTIEHQEANYQPDREDEVWEGAAHHWNCHEERVVELLKGLGFVPISYSQRIPDNPSHKTWYDPDTNMTWPVVGKNHWQCAVQVRAF